MLIAGCALIVATGVSLSSSTPMSKTRKDRLLRLSRRRLDADCILIFGCGVWDDGTPTPMLSDRLKTGIEIYNAGGGDRLLMSGDHGRADYDEVNAMKKFAVDRGIESGAVFMDHAGFSTYESVFRAKEVFKAKKVILVTQEYHLYRALYVAKALGLDAYGVSDCTLRRQYYDKDISLVKVSIDFKPPII